MPLSNSCYAFISDDLANFDLEGKNNGAAGKESGSLLTEESDGTTGKIKKR